MSLAERDLVALGLADPIQRRRLYRQLETVREAHQEMLTDLAPSALTNPAAIVQLSGLSTAAATAANAIPPTPKRAAAHAVSATTPGQRQLAARPASAAAVPTGHPPAAVPASALPASGGGGAAAAAAAAGAPLPASQTELGREDDDRECLGQIVWATASLRSLCQKMGAHDPAQAVEEDADAVDAAANPRATTMFSKILAQERRKMATGRMNPFRRRYWHEIIGEPASSVPADVARQVKVDLRFKHMRKNSRVIEYRHVGDDDVDGQDADANAFGNEHDDESVVDADAGDDPSDAIVTNWWIILPSNSWRLRWDMFIMLLVIYYGIMTPIELAFGNDVSNIYLDYAFDALFGLDIVLNFFTAYRIEHGHQKGQVETRMFYIAKTYLKRWFWIDLVATVPMDVVFDALNIGFTASFNKLIRLLRGFKMVRVLKVSRIFKRFSQVSQSNPALQRLITYILMLLIMWHWIGCGYWVIAQYDGFDDGGWAPSPYYLTAPFGSRYMQAYFWAICSTTGVGVDINPRTVPSLAFTIGSICIGCMMYAFIIGSMTTALQNLDALGVEKRTKLERIYQFLKARDIDRTLQTRILDYYDYAYDNTLHGVELLDDLHSALKIRLDLALNQKLINNVPMFRNLSRNCILSIIERLHLKMFLPKEYICLKGEPGTEMFFIVRGRVEVMIPERTRRNRVILKEGGFFGEKCLLESTRRQFTIQAVTHCELLVLRKSETKHLLRHFPDFAASMQKYALSRMNVSGWPKIQFIVRTVRMVKLLGGQTTFVDMYRKINTDSKLRNVSESSTVSLVDDGRVAGENDNELPSTPGGVPGLSHDAEAPMSPGLFIRIQQALRVRAAAWRQRRSKLSTRLRQRTATILPLATSFRRSTSRATIKSMLSSRGDATDGQVAGSQPLPEPNVVSADQLLQTAGGQTPQPS
ncbi:Cyclic nucleotide-binding domain-containing protein [Plasmodiophora brassicae]|uniref:Cyclic nucleotide-binding domain-containing protein n=1 Tax=Plasmodiophora brassicae TaxID=37360 RepID=A0A0G4IV84_PLABS|nr:hypothetical protein PBRA_001017 [Plasmodiophora brassicae]